MKLLFIFLLFLAVNCRGQIKIGDITIPDSLAKEYFWDCHKNPTVKYYVRCWLPAGFYSAGEVTQSERWREIERQDYIYYKSEKYKGVKHFNGEERRCQTKVESNPRAPSASDFAIFMRRKSKTR